MTAETRNPAEDRATRRAAALRANLHRRKDQARARAATDPADPQPQAVPAPQPHAAPPAEED